MTPGTKAQPARCDDCGHVWTVAYLPMDLTLFARLAKSARCPRCGSGSDRVFLQVTREQEAHG